MGAVFLAFLSLLLSSGCSSGFELDQNEYGIEAHQSDKVLPNFLDLNNDVLYMILYRLELNELLSVAEAIPELSDLIDEVFRRKYFRNQPMIKIFITKNYDPDYAAKFNEKENITVITDVQTSIKLFKHYGHLLQKVYIQYEKANNSDVEIINLALNEYCSKSLKQLELYIPRGVKDQFTTPFTRVEEFTIHITEYGLNASKPFNEIFPNLRSLNLNLEMYTDISFIDKPFSHLNHLYLSTKYPFYGTNKISLEQFKGVIMKNPTIQSLGFGMDYPPNFLTFVNEALPNLENLKTTWLFIDDSEILQFDNVKSFGLYGRTDDIHNYEKISLPNLESIEMFCTDLEIYHNLTQFFKRHTKLKQLTVMDHGICGSMPEFTRMIAELPNLVDLTLYGHEYCGIETIVQLIQSKEQSQKVCLFFNIDPITTKDVTAIQQQLQNEWTVEAIEVVGNDDKVIKGTLFERKQLIQQ